jgi:hypothetical protein
MKPNPNLDELLCSFMDGELSPRQRTEVQRMATRDAEVARRLQQLQSCRSLFRALPLEKAPSDLLEQIKVSLERHCCCRNSRSSGNARSGRGSWRFAGCGRGAVIALMGSWGGGLPDRGARPAGQRPWRPTAAALWKRARSDYGDSADGGRCRFTGRLELRTPGWRMRIRSSPAIENSGLSGQDRRISPATARVRVTGTARRQSLRGVPERRLAEF